MATDDKFKKCPEYCPFLKANNTYCELFKKTLQSTGGIAQKCDPCMNPEQRMSSYQELGLSMDSRIEMWQKAVLKHNEIELEKKRQEEELRQKFASFLEEKYGARPPLEGNTYLSNLAVNLYMVLDGTERSMMMSVLNSASGHNLLSTLDRLPKDESLLRNFRHELDSEYFTLQRNVQQRQQQQMNTK